jgi:general secretion pathway protein G
MVERDWSREGMLYLIHKGRKALRYCLGKSRRILSKKLVGGFTLIELMVVVAILGTITGIAIPAYQTYIEKARVAKAIAEIDMMQGEIAAFIADTQELPNTLNDIGRGTLLDPWENNYQYYNLGTAAGKGAMRKDRFMVPLNTDYDLYSMGKDGKTKPPLTAKASHDDVIRANDGRFIGLASEY